MRMVMKKKFSFLALGAVLLSFSAEALELNWSGQFWSEWHYLKDYTLDSSTAGESFDPARGNLADPGYYIPSGGSTSASFETLFMRLRPSLVVNDTVHLKSELWAGDPTFGLFGNAVPYTLDQRQYYSTQSRGAVLSAQRYWVELLSDFGTLQVGRAPLNWGLGVVWNAGDDLWSRYASTADLVRLVSKFGSFSFSPSLAIYSNGNNVGGSCRMGGAPATCVPGQGNGGMTDYSLALRYDNIEEELEGGLNFIKRLSGPVQDLMGYSLVGPAQANYNLWDAYARKKIGQFTLAGELPVLSGSIGGMDYSGYALAADVRWKPSENWETSVRLGRAPGQPASDTATPNSYRAFFFNPNYHLGMVLFHYQLANFAGPNTGNTAATSTVLSPLRSPFDHPIMNAHYLSVGESFKTEKWTLNAGVIYAQALEVAEAGRYFLHQWQKTLVKNNTGKDQSHSLGTELDLGAAFQWDDHVSLRFDTGIWFPGAFYQFSNTARDNTTDSVWASSAKLGVAF